jgi:hypothetical protein
MHPAITLPAPACWASYLVNADASGLDAEEVAAADEWIAREVPPGASVDVMRDAEGEPMDAWFSWSYGLYGGTASGGDLLEYVIA